MFWKKRFCNHDFHHVQDTLVEVGHYMDSELDSACWIFCPKCKKEERVRLTEWKRIEKQQEITKEYIQQNIAKEYSRE